MMLKSGTKNFMRIFEAIVLILLMLFELASCGGGSGITAVQTIRNVSAAKARISDITVNVEYAGRIKASRELYVTSKLAGKAAEVKADVGDSVKEGQKLFTVETNEAEAQKKQAEIDYSDAKRFFDNTKKLFDGGAASQQQMDDARSKFDSAKVQLDLASQQLGYSATISPISGIVAARTIDPGEMVSTQAPAFTILDTSNLTIEITIPDTALKNVSEGQKINAAIIALDEKPVVGTIDTVSPAADARTLGYTVKLKIDNPDGLIKPGMIARVLVPTERKEKVLTVPNDAIVVENGVEYAYIEENGSVGRVELATGASDGSMTEVMKGLKEGETVLLDSQSFLNSGDKVTVEYR